MDAVRLVVPQPEGARIVALTRFPFRIGRHHENELKLDDADVSRHHAEIIQDGERYFLSDSNSRFGTYLNGTKIEREPLVHGDHIQLGSPNHPALEFQMVSAEITASITELGKEGGPENGAAQPQAGMQLLGQAMRAMVEGRVLEEVLAIVVDHAIQVSGAERGFVMLAGKDGELEIKMARGRRGQSLPGRDFQISRSVPRRVHDTGKLAYENEVPETRDTQINLKIRSILCAPLPRMRTTEQETGDTAAQAEARRPMGVIYLDSGGLGRLEAPALHATLEQLTVEAAVAIENAHLMRESEVKRLLERELDVARQIQEALLPPRIFASGPIELAGTTIPCRAIGGDFYEYAELAEGRLGFALCDVSGKGPGAALLAAAIQGILASSSEASPGPGEILARLNRTLLRRNIERRFATIAYGTLDPSGTLRLTSAGHNPAYLLSADGKLSKLDKGGLMVGVFPGLEYDEDVVELGPGDSLILYSDGVTEAEDASGGQYEEERLESCLATAKGMNPDAMVAHVVESVRAFARGYAQADDITVLVVRFGGDNARTA